MGASMDCDRFRLRRLVERLAAAGEACRVEQSLKLAELAWAIEQTPQASWFRDVGPDHLEIAAGISGSRRRIAMAFETDERKLMPMVARRLATPQPIVEVSWADARVHARVVTGDSVDLTKLPCYLQHELDGGPYISSAIDFSIDPESGKRNVGCRRLMLKGRTTCTTNLTNNSDLRLKLAGPSSNHGQHELRQQARIIGSLPKRKAHAGCSFRLSPRASTRDHRQPCSRLHCRSSASCVGSIVVSPVSLATSVESSRCSTSWLISGRASVGISDRRATRRRGAPLARADGATREAIS
jgi:3-octaprenyl-4-hydroxybenzoate carboxy-lyase